MSAISDILPSDAAMRTQIGRFDCAAFLEARSRCELHFGFSRGRMAREYPTIANALSVVNPELDVPLQALREARNVDHCEIHLTLARVVDLLTFARGLAAETLTKLKMLQA